MLMKNTIIYYAGISTYLPVIFLLHPYFTILYYWELMGGQSPSALMSLLTARNSLLFLIWKNNLFPAPYPPPMH